MVKLQGKASRIVDFAGHLMHASGGPCGKPFLSIDGDRAGARQDSIGPDKYFLTLGVGRNPLTLEEGTSETSVETFVLKMFPAKARNCR